MHTMSHANPTYFHLQECFDGDHIGLHCPSCGVTIDAPLDWVAARPGEHIGCPQCMRIHAIPTIEPLRDE